MRARHILPLLAMRRTKHGSGLGRWRWVVERTFAWLNQFRRLRVRYDKRADIHEAFLSLGCVWICWQSLRKGWMTTCTGFSTRPEAGNINTARLIGSDRPKRAGPRRQIRGRYADRPNSVTTAARPSQIPIGSILSEDADLPPISRYAASLAGAAGLGRQSGRSVGGLYFRTRD